MPTLFKNGKNYSGTSVSLTQAEYDALTETQKNDGTVYFITDSDAVLDASDVALGSGTVETLAGSIATIETSPATANHSVGEYIVCNGQLYKVTTAITSGTTLTGKISAVNVGDEFISVNNRLLSSGYVLTIAPQGERTSAKITFPNSSALNNVLIFGRYGYNSATLSMSIIANPSEGTAHVKNFGDQNITVSAVGSTVTITFPQTIARVVAISSVPITISYD